MGHIFRMQVYPIYELLLIAFVILVFIDASWCRALNTPSPCSIAVVSDPSVNSHKSVQVAALKCQQGTIQWMYPSGQLHLAIQTADMPTMNLESPSGGKFKYRTQSENSNYAFDSEDYIVDNFESVTICLKPQQEHNGVNVLSSTGEKYTGADIRKLSRSRRMLCESFDISQNSNIDRIYSFRLQGNKAGNFERDLSVTFEYFIAWS